MDDLISRQVAITAIQKAYADTVGGTDRCAVWKNVGLTNALHIMQDLPSVQTKKMQLSKEDATKDATFDCISRETAIEALSTPHGILYPIRTIEELPSAQPEPKKYEYHYDHTDCIWYRPEARNRCPVTCAQYRDGWNDAMNYIFRDGKGYRPYRRDKQYEE